MALEDIDQDVIMEPINRLRDRYGDAVVVAATLLGGPIGWVALYAHMALMG